MKSFVLNGHGRLVFPSNFFPELDFSVFESLDQLAEVIRRDFEEKAPTGTEILERVEAGAYGGRFELLRDLALHLSWVNRYAITMYEKRPTRWRDVPRHRDDVFLPVVTAWEEGERKIAAVEDAYPALAPTWDAAAEDRVYGILIDLYRHKLHLGSELPAIKPTVAEILSDPANQTFCLPTYDPDSPTYSYDDIIDCSLEVPELEALLRRSMVLHNQYPWDRTSMKLASVGELDDDDFVVIFAPRNSEVAEFIRRVRSGEGQRRPTRRAGPITSTPPVAPYPPLEISKRFGVLPRIESLAVVKGEHVCTNEDVIRNSAYNWSPMTAEEIRAKTGISARLYTERTIEEIALDAAQGALAHAQRGADEISAVVVCTCTSTRSIPSVAAWLSGQLGILQTHASVDLVSACAGFAYGLSEAVRLLQETERSVLLVCAEKFSDKIGSVRPSRMIFGDGAAAVVLSPAEPGAGSDIEILQTYASGPESEVNSIIWPNPEFDNNITVYGPEVNALVRRYLAQMIAELEALPAPGGTLGSLLDCIDVVVPHQANKTMVVRLSGEAGLAADKLYFNIEQMGNVSAASVPIAIADAIAEGVIDRPMLVFTPSFGAGAVGGYGVLRIDPQIVAPEYAAAWDVEISSSLPQGGGSSEDFRMAFGD